MAGTKNIIGLGMDPPVAVPLQVNHLTLDFGSSASRMRQKTADGEALAISLPAGETRVLKYFQERMPYGLLPPRRKFRKQRAFAVIILMSAMLR
jgi:hypothetical protein